MAENVKHFCLDAYTFCRYIEGMRTRTVQIGYRATQLHRIQLAKLSSWRSENGVEGKVSQADILHELVAAAFLAEQERRAKASNASNG